MAAADFVRPQRLWTGRSAVQADGKIIQIAAPNYVAGDTVVSRLNADGTLDTTFGAGGYARFDTGGRLELPNNVVAARRQDRRPRAQRQPDGPPATATWANDMYLAG